LKVILLIHCEDHAGIICAVTGFLSKHGGNITYLDQHVDDATTTFFMRLESDFSFESAFLPDFKKEFDENLGKPYKMHWLIHTRETRLKMALFVSKYEHCLYDLLSRYQSGELAVDIPFILSNHESPKAIADRFNIPFYHVPVTKTTKEEAAEKQLAIVQEHDIDFIVLARYMQIISPKLIAKYPNDIINIHHSFLPAFVGAKPYHAAFERGVKIIGATSHYITEALDAGPIIQQDVSPVSHTHSIGDLIALGRDLEKIVLSRAVQLHIQRKTIVCHNKTIIFS